MPAHDPGHDAPRPGGPVAGGRVPVPASGLTLDFFCARLADFFLIIFARAWRFFEERVVCGMGTFFLGEVHTRALRVKKKPAPGKKTKGRSSSRKTAGR